MAWRSRNQLNPQVIPGKIHTFEDFIRISCQRCLYHGESMMLVLIFFMLVFEIETNYVLHTNYFPFWCCF